MPASHDVPPVSLDTALEGAPDDWRGPTFYQLLTALVVPRPIGWISTIDREGRVNLRGAYAIARNGELWLENAHIAVYEHGNRYNHEPLRNRKLLLHKREIEQLQAKVATKGLTLIPLKLYLKHGRAKIELGLARGKKLYDKREAIAERDSKREMERVIRKR